MDYLIYMLVYFVYIALVALMFAIIYRIVFQFIGMDDDSNPMYIFLCLITDPIASAVDRFLDKNGVKDFFPIDISLFASVILVEIAVSLFSNFI